MEVYITTQVNLNNKFKFQKKSAFLCSVDAITQEQQIKISSLHTSGLWRGTSWDNPIEVFISTQTTMWPVKQPVGPACSALHRTQSVFHLLNSVSCWHSNFWSRLRSSMRIQLSRQVHKTCPVSSGLVPRPTRRRKSTAFKSSVIASPCRSSRVKLAVWYQSPR